MSRGRHIGYAISVAVVIVIVFSFDWGKIAEELANFKFAYLIPAFAIYVLGFVLRGIRWQYMLEPLKHVHFKNSFMVTMVGFMANNLLPLRMGEFVRAWAIKRKEGISGTAGFATIAIERVFDGLTLIGLLVVVLLFSGVSERIKTCGVIGAMVFFAALGMMLFSVYRPEQANFVIKQLMRLVPKRFHERADRLVESFLEGLHFLSSIRQQLIVLFYSVCIWLMEGSVFWIIMQGFGMNLPPYAALVTLVFVNIVIMIPAMPGYVGTFDYAAVVALEPFGIEGNMAMSYIIVVHALQYVSVTGLGLYFMNATGWSLKEIEGAEKA